MVPMKILRRTRLKGRFQKQRSLRAISLVSTQHVGLAALGLLSYREQNPTLILEFWDIRRPCSQSQGCVTETAADGLPEQPLFVIIRRLDRGEAWCFHPKTSGCEITQSNPVACGDKGAAPSGNNPTYPKRWDMWATQRSQANSAPKPAPTSAMNAHHPNTTPMQVPRFTFVMQE